MTTAGRPCVLPDDRPKNLRELGLPALFGAAVLFFSATMLLGVNISAMRTSLTWMQRTQTMLAEISAAESGVVGDELTVRSYALTGDPRFLLFQKLERAKLQRSMSALKRLAASEPGGAERVGRIRAFVDRHTALYTAITGFGPDKAALVANVINDDEKRAVMVRARRELAAYRIDKMHVLQDRQQDLTQQLSQAFVLAIGIIVAAFVIGGIGLMMVQVRLPFRR